MQMCSDVLNISPQNLKSNRDNTIVPIPLPRSFITIYIFLPMTVFSSSVARLSEHTLKNLTTVSRVEVLNRTYLHTVADESVVGTYLQYKHCA